MKEKYLFTKSQVFGLKTPLNSQFLGFMSET